MSPLASGMVLPCSRASSRRACRCRAATRSRNFISTRARRCGLVAAQAGCAALAFSTAARSSALRGQRHPGRDLAGHRLEHVGEAAGGAGDLLAADEMIKLRRHDAAPPRVRGFERWPAPYERGAAQNPEDDRPSGELTQQPATVAMPATMAAKSLRATIIAAIAATIPAHSGGPPCVAVTASIEAKIASGIMRSRGLDARRDRHEAHQEIAASAAQERGRRHRRRSPAARQAAWSSPSRLASQRLVAHGGDDTARERAGDDVPGPGSSADRR